MVHFTLAQVAEQGTQMTPVGELVTTHMGRLSMLAKVNETGVQVDFFLLLRSICSADLFLSLYLWLNTFFNLSQVTLALKGDSGPGRTLTGVHSCRVREG